jgi:acid phosphatase
VHRHGDRTPVTPLKDEAFWTTCLIPDKTLQTIATNTELIHGDAPSNKFGKGVGAFGRLTELGLVQMVKVGGRLRNELSTEVENHMTVDAAGNQHHAHVWRPDRPLHPSNIRIFSTDFPRTIESVQGLLVGLFPQGFPESIPIDTRNASWMMPDPIRLRMHTTKDSAQHSWTEKDEEMHQLGIKAALALRDMLGEGTNKMPINSFYVDGGDEVKQNPVAWIQLSEVTTCLMLRDRLPPGITTEDRNAITQHAAKWSFELLRHPYMEMNTMVRRQVDDMMRHDSEAQPPVTVWSGHDFTLIGLMLAYKLEQPALWPEYGSFLKLELLQVSHVEAGGETELVVRFSLNGERLRSACGGNGEFLDLVPLHILNQEIPDEFIVEAS